jgi:TPR repeat protein
MKWYRKAAEKGFMDAEYKIGYFYQMGYGVTKDRTQALNWYHKAAEAGSDEALNAMKEMQRN